MKLNRIKFALDVVLAVVLGLLYTVHAQLGLAWHEWAGIAIALAFIVHIVLSWNWVVAVTKRLLGRTTPRARLLYVLDILVLASMGWAIVSGVLISRVAVPQLAVGGIFRTTHIPVSYVALVLIGVHLGLHWDWALSVVRRLTRRPRVGGAALWAVRGMAALVLVGGVYSVVATNALSQSAALFGVGGVQVGERGGAGGPGGMRGGSGQVGAPPAGGESHDGGMRGGGRGEGMRGGEGGGARGSDALSLLLHSGVIAAFAVPTYYADRALANRRRRRPSVVQGAAAAPIS